MSKTVLTFGLIAGGILSVMMVVTMLLFRNIGFDKSEIVGYTTIVLAFLLVFFGVRSYRDNVGGGTISFGRAFSVGAMIVLVASACYVLTWELIYFNMPPDFTEKLQAHMVERARARADSPQELEESLANLQKYTEWYRNPLLNAAITLIEPLPVGLVMALIAAGVLRRRTPPQPV